jgi:hypothetical protein
LLQKLGKWIAGVCCVFRSASAADVVAAAAIHVHGDDNNYSCEGGDNDE